VSKDAGRTWSRSFWLPLDGLQSLSSIYSSMVRPDGRCLLFHGSARTVDPPPPCVSEHRRQHDLHFMSFRPRTILFSGARSRTHPRGYMLPNGRILCVLRCQRDPTSVMWTEVYKSDDGGQAWQFLSRVNDFGAPGSLVRMRDGRLVMVYGYRLPPFGIRAVVSEDEGLTWDPEIVVRDDGGSWDLGYPNAWEAEPGKLGVIYYFNSKDDPVQVKPGNSLAGPGGVRHIVRSFFSVD
jgi:hypothetical protein